MNVSMEENPEKVRPRCSGGVECINLEDCTGLYNQLQRGTNPQLTALLRGLHCGFNGDTPMTSPVHRVQRPKASKPRIQRPYAPELNIFDLGFWGFTPRPPMRPKHKKKMTSSRQKQKPIMRPNTVKPELVRPTMRVTSKPTVMPLVQRPVFPKSQQICCPPEFQGYQNDGSSSTSAGSWSGNTNRGSGSWNRGGASTNTNNGANDWDRGGSTNTNGGNGWNNEGANTNTNNNGGSSWNGGSGSNRGGTRGGGSSDPTSLLPNQRECGIQNNDRIVGGSRADIDEHPWMTLLRYDKPVGWGFYCGGVLISSRYVLTAAHCVKGEDLPTNWRLSQVRLGEWNTSSVNDCVMDDCASPVQDIRVEEIIAHEGYDPQDSNQHNDIALLRLAQPAQYNDFVKPICLPLSNDVKNNGFDGSTAEVAGWGKTESRSESEVKLKVNVPVVSRSQCASVFSRVNREIWNKQLCAGGLAGKDSCRGDSGGALMGRVPTADNWFAIGVVSYGPSPCGTPGWPGVYTRVGAYVDWIVSKIRA
ncbi:hypothetical protein O0L34_g3390 [Tuta absoluta]|nr:hypothetical protein O0L34_g3390 [Tuta absoluta]